MSAASAGPLAIIAELTHVCPLHCVYCSNPLELNRRANELSTEDWVRVFRDAAQHGALQLDLTGGEPLVRADLAELIRAARTSGLYVNLITSGMPLDEARLDALLAAGLDHIQLSFQGAHEESANEFSGTKAHALKLRVLGWLKERRIAVTLNFVIHRRNIDQVPEMLAIAESSSSNRIEFANVQYYGWAFANRDNLLPTREQLDRSLAFLKAAQERLRGKMQIESVVPDYYAKYPKACMGGWARKLILIAPNGNALPCHAARIIPELRFDNVKNHGVIEIWQNSDAFRKFRGEEWMSEPCKSCDRRSLDFGGCRCQALLLTQDATLTDPVCQFSPQRPVVDAILAAVNNNGPTETASASAKPAWHYRPNPV